MDTSPTSTSLLYRAIDPVRQVLLVFSAVVVFNLVAAFVRATGIMDV
ncbi:MAG: hypothetical protein IPN33_21725 [Saprospiraceae bacterium]|nr:hypothetical protein [Saprospiraceae bacterium]